MKKLTIMAFTLFSSALIVLGQNDDATKYLISKESKCTVEGTSTISDWTVEVQEIYGEVQMKAGENLDISTVKITVPVKSMKGRADAMDEKTREAFKSETYPNITFESSQIKILKKEGDTFMLETSGKLSMAGHVETIVVQFDGKKAAGNYVFTGEIPLKLSTFEMEAPTAFFGSLEVADPVKVVFSLTTSLTEE